MKDSIEVSAPSGLEDDLLRVLRDATSAPALGYDGAPTRLTGGFWAELLAFRLSGAPEGWRGELVARVMPDRATGAKETVIQAEVAAQGFPTPAVHLSGGPDDGLGRAFMVMDLAPGGPLLAGLSGLGALRELPKLARRIPESLAQVMAALHRLDPEPVRRRLQADGSPTPGIGEVLARLEAAAAAMGRADLVAAARWLEQHPTAPVPDVICHGDLHPFNLLVDDAGSVTVLDWSAALLGPPSYDVAFTSLLLAEPPLAAPRPVGPLVRGAGRFLARRFVRRYERLSEIRLDGAAVRWHQGVVCLRALVEVAGWVTAGEVAERHGHPWLVCGPAFAARLSRLTGVQVAHR